MSKTNYNFTNFSTTHFDLINQKWKGYSFFLVSKDVLEITIPKNQNLENLILFFKEKKVVSIGFIKKQTLPDLKKELNIIQQKIDFTRSHFAVLLQYKNPNTPHSQTNLPSEESFLISANEFIQLYEKEIQTGLCYHFMLKVLQVENQLEQIIAYQIGHPNPLIFESGDQPVSMEVIMPHRGDSTDLEAALWYLQKQKVAPQKVSVCFDEAVSEGHFKMADKNPQVGFFANYPSGVGPYPSRDILARATEEKIIVFHDSDDVSTTDRISALSQVLDDKKWDAIGSHELRINKIEKKIEAVRFPIDVLKTMCIHQDRYSIFFPSTAIKKTAYLKTGGLSTVRKHSSDSQFYRRAYFFLNLKNVDEFLYIRVKHENSLTTAKQTTLGSPVRERLKRQWVNDFIKIQHQNISLNESTLVDEPNVSNVDLIPLQKEYRESILKWQELTQFLQKENPFRDLSKPDFPEEEAILEGRLLDYTLVKDPGVQLLKQSLSWRIGWAITRVIILLFGWIPYVKKRM